MIWQDQQKKEKKKENKGKIQPKFFDWEEIKKKKKGKHKRRNKRTKGRKITNEYPSNKKEAVYKKKKQERFLFVWFFFSLPFA